MGKLGHSGSVLAAWEQAKLAEREQTITTASCMWCAWTQHGTLLETREAYTAHRLEAHPEIQPRKQLRRKRLFGQMSTQSQLSDNIANTRAQGGATWAGPDA